MGVAREVSGGGCACGDESGWVRMVVVGMVKRVEDGGGYILLGLLAKPPESRCCSMTRPCDRVQVCAM